MMQVRHLSNIPANYSQLYLVFTEDDFKGFKNVGEGSKANDKTTIGQFGRGSQTMYHWTDVPMVLSGKYLLILE
jgi:sacsin